MGSSRGNADRLPLGRFAVPDPDDESRMTYWRVEQDGRHRVLRPWPADVRWAPWRPDYPVGLDAQQRKVWSQQWYDSKYFGWKEEVVSKIAEDPQAAADEFARSAPSAELPPPVRKRLRVRVRPKRVSAKQREIEAQALLALALRRAGLSERQIAGETGLPKTTVHRRLEGTALADGLAQVLLEVRVSNLMGNVLEAARTAGPEDVPGLLAKIDRVRALQAHVLGLADGSAEEPRPFGPSLTDGAR